MDVIIWLVLVLVVLAVLAGALVTMQRKRRAGGVVGTSSRSRRGRP